MTCSGHVVACLGVGDWRGEKSVLLEENHENIEEYKDKESVQLSRRISKVIFSPED